MEFNNTNHTWNTAPSPAQTDETQDRSLLQRCPQIKYKSTIATVVCLGLVICLALVAYFVLADEGTPEPTADISTLKLTSIVSHVLQVFY